MTRVAVAAAVIACGLAGGHVSAARTSLVERVAYLMGTRAALSVWAPSRGEGLTHLERALAVLESTEAQLSTWRDDSRLSSLNRAPLHVPWQAGRELCDLLATVTDWHHDTSGAFDPAIGPLMLAWDLRGAGRVPSAQALARARAASGLRYVGLDRAACTVTRRRAAALDAGAFGKGEGLDRAARALAGLPWLIDLGGQVSAGAAPPASTGWPVAIAHPADRSRPFLDLRLVHGSVATSGGSERDLTADGQRIGHILDPRTGMPAEFRGSVTVWHERGLVADILSTALFVMGPAEGLRWAGSRGIAACFLDVDAQGHVTTEMTPEFQGLLRSTLRDRSPSG